MSVTLHPAATDLKTLEKVWRNGTPARLAPGARDLIEAAAAQVRDAAMGDEPMGIRANSLRTAAISKRRMTLLGRIGKNGHQRFPI